MPPTASAHPRAWIRPSTKKLRDAFEVAVASPEFKPVTRQDRRPGAVPGRPRLRKVRRHHVPKETVADRTTEAQGTDEELIVSRTARWPAHGHQPLIRLHANDNVLVAKTALALGQEPDRDSARVRAPGAGRATRSPHAASAQGERVLKYDTVIGMAARDIEPGDYVHAHNMKLVDFDRDPGFGAGRAAGGLCARRRTRHVHGLCAPRRARGHAQLHRHSVVGQLFGHRHQEHRGVFHARAAG